MNKPETRYKTNNNYDFFMFIAKDGCLEDIIQLDNVRTEESTMSSGGLLDISGNFTYSRQKLIHSNKDKPVEAIHLIYDIARLIKIKEKLEAEIETLKVQPSFIV